MFSNHKTAIILYRLAERLKPRLELNEYNVLISLAEYIEKLDE